MIILGDELPVVDECHFELIRYNETNLWAFRCIDWVFLVMNGMNTLLLNKEKTHLSISATLTRVFSSWLTLSALVLGARRRRLCASSRLSLLKDAFFQRFLFVSVLYCELVHAGLGDPFVPAVKWCNEMVCIGAS